MDHPFSKRSTDRIVFDFGLDFEPLIEFGSNAISRMVNERNSELLKRSVQFLEKKQQKMAREDFEFLIQNEIHCVPLTPSVMETGYQYLQAFEASGEKFKTTFRNTWNDLLILATAENRGDELWSEDNQLNRFAATTFGELKEGEFGTLEIRLTATPKGPEKRLSRESKGYVNTGWRATFRNPGNKP
jgi:hypothetical protein